MPVFHVTCVFVGVYIVFKPRKTRDWNDMNKGFDGHVSAESIGCIGGKEFETARAMFP